MARVKLKDVVMRVKDKADKDNTELEFYVGGEHIDGNEICVTKKGIIQGSTIGPAFHMAFKAGDVLLMSRNPHLRKASMVDFDGICSDVSYVCRTKDENVLLQSYLPFLLQSDDFWRFAEENKKGGLPFFLNWSDFERYEFELPSIEKQRELSDLLWAMQRTKQAYQELLAKTDDLVKSQFIEMFGDPVLNEKSWPMVQIGDIAEIKIGPFGSLLHKEDYIEGGHALINPSHIIEGQVKPDPKLTVSDEKYAELSSYSLRINDVVLGRRGEMGRCAVVYEEGYLCGTGSMIIRPGDKMKPYFLQTILSSPTYKRVIEGKAVGVTMMNINVPIVSSLLMPALPIALQERYLELVEQSDKSKFELKQNIENINSLMRSLMRQDFTN